MRPGERLDDLQRGGLRIIQSGRHFAFSIDAVLLAHFASIRSRGTVVDLGTGSGVIPLLLSHRSPHARITGIELAPEVADMANRSILTNGLGDRISVIQGDLRHIRKLMPAGTADLVTSNPPYMPLGTGEISLTEAQQMARHEVTCRLEDVLAAAAWLLRTGGKFALVHRPERLGDIMAALRGYRLEAKRLRLAHPLADRKASMVLLEAVKNARPGLTVEPPIYIHNPDGTYTGTIQTLYEGGALS